MAMKSYIDDLFKYIDTFENDHAQFKTEAFLQTYTGIVNVFQTLRTDRNQAVEIDYYLLDKIKLSPLTSSDLRQVTIQILITRFETEADTDGRSNQAYTYCRNLRPVKQDVAFCEGNLVKLLFVDGSLNNNHQLGSFFLGEIGSYINKFGKSVNTDLSPESFEALPDSLKVLELQRRRLALSTDLVKDRTSLEFHLQRVEVFSRMGSKSKIMESYLKDWDYLAITTFWSRVAGFSAELGTKLKGAFSSFGYFRLLSSQRSLAYFVYMFVIVLFLGLAIGIPSWWNGKAERKLVEFQERANSLHEGTGK